ncbi:MAG: TlpA family protein disulfide reductase [Anaerolineales bacterium]|nr:TlpA family protein disulfide reductase [Anaerolineales bacterium]
MTEQTTPVPERAVPIWVQIIVWILLSGLLVLVALGLKNAQNPIIRVGSEVPDFNLTLFEGYTYEGSPVVSLSALHGKVVVLNFWASWCKPCEQEAAELEEVWRSYAEVDAEVVFLGVAWTDTPANSLEYLQKFEVTYPNGPDLGSRISAVFNRNLGVPETYLIDKEGILRAVKIGPFASNAEIKSFINPLLSE